MRRTRILVVDDDQAILRFLCANLRARDYEVMVATDGKQALDAVESEFVDLMILDIMMPKLDGVEVCRRVRQWSKLPIIILSARGDEKEKVTCLELGADDYLTKPFGVEELMARIKTALRHCGSESCDLSEPNFACGDLTINFDMRRVTVRDEEVKLTPTEYAVLQQLASNVGKVLTHDVLLQRVWGEQYYSEKEYLRVFISRLRRKLEPDPEEPRYILTDPGVGYHFAAP